jgi:hypothetical protein
MALDCQSNWNIQMRREDPGQTNKREGLTLVHATGLGPDTDLRSRAQSLPMTDDRHSTSEATLEAVYLPDEIIIQILEYLADTREAQHSLASVALLSHQWYSAAVPFLYRQPNLYGKNFDPFARAICPSINLHVRNSPLSKLVRILDLGKLVHQGSKRITARLLGRTKEGLEYFRAPQASFGVSCLPALAKCQSLRTLDLSLVSESPPLVDLLRTVSRLDTLFTLRLPRSSGFGPNTRPSAFTWPPNLRDLALSGGIDTHFLHGVVAFPQTLRSITIEHCPRAKGEAVTYLLRTAVGPLQNLEELRIAHMPCLSSHALDGILFLVPQIRKLSVSVDYITPAMFDEGHFNHIKATRFALPHTTPNADSNPDSSGAILSSSPFCHENLHTLELTNSGKPSVEDKISPIDIMIAMDEGVLPALRVVRVAKSLFWQSNATAGDAEALADALTEASRLDWEAKRGAFAMGKIEAREYEKRDWAKKAGVWTFES